MANEKKGSKGKAAPKKKPAAPKAAKKAKDGVLGLDPGYVYRLMEGDDARGEFWVYKKRVTAFDVKALAFFEDRLEAEASATHFIKDREIPKDLMARVLEAEETPPHVLSALLNAKLR